MQSTLDRQPTEQAHERGDDPRQQCRDGHDLFAINKLGAIAVLTMSIDELRFENTIPLDIELKPTDICMLVYTGGTTGPSKGCMNSRSYLCGLARRTQIMGGRDSKTICPCFTRNKRHERVVPDERRRTGGDVSALLRVEFLARSRTYGGQ
ncbi:AMP-binding protein [Paraburkholderia saeva]|uniref:AMP-binding protein n=1 Tax=Paraburkholderia saeva TaxID=2777537 RepID=UPI001DD0580E|nr:AMP-binding protein [Paraburkholderia saeva]CAG4895568.1 hypothetical protein R52603_02014 [Paraburkholderia saeva]